MTTPVRQRDRVAILNALRARVVPGRGLEHLQVGRAAEVQALVGDIKHIRERGTAVRFVVGEYGSGKSFFLQVIRHAAQRAGCVTMGADLAQDARLYGTGGRVMSLYSSLISSTGTKSQPDGGAMGEVLERFCSECDDRARRERRDAEAVLHNRLAPLKGFRGGYEFADVVVTYWRAARHGDETRREAVLRWLSGQYRTKGEARAAIGVNGVIGDSDLYPTLRLLAMFIREAGYAGLLVELDELAVLARLNKPTRDQNYEQILTMVNDLLAGRAEGLGILFAGTPEFANDPTRGLASYGALRQRLSPNEFVRPGMHDTAGPVINLASLTPEDLYVLLENVHRVYCSNGHRDPLSSPRALEAFLDHCSAQLGGLAKVTPREATRSFLHFLDILDQNRDQRWESVLDHVEVSIDEDVLLSQHRVDAEFASLIGLHPPGRTTSPTLLWGEVTSIAASGQDSAFASLHPQIQELVRHELGWRRLRPVQAAAVPHVLAARRDVLIVSGTATGKTEAAWLPIFSSLLRQPVPGLGVLCVSPLKTLIGDQVKRLARYGRHLDVRVEGWHGDVASSRKQRLLSEPPLALVTTPESLQGILLHRRQKLAAAAAGLRYVVVDEVHAFAGTDRGHQLQHLLAQLERLAGARTCRVALSATVSKPDLIAEFLRPGTGDAAVVVQPSSGEAGQLDVRVFGFLTRPSMTRRSGTERADRDLNVRDVADGDRLDIARQIDSVTRGRRALVFAGSRLAVEEMTALVRDVNVTGTRRPDRFLAHHGSLSRELRRTAEVALHERDDATVICTSTLELGVDLPHLDLVAQVDTCLSVATLRQRLGRSGRKPGTRPKLRVYSAERPLAPQEAPSTRLRAGLAQNVASIELIVRENWVEPADLAPLGLSTLLQQTLAMLADPAGSSAKRLFEQLCIRGPWRRVSSTQFAGLLRSLGEHGLIRQDGRRLLLLDEAGQKLVGRRDFLTAFTTPTDYTLRHEGKELGTLPISYPLTIGASLAFAGRTWRVAEVHAGGWVVDVVPHHTGLPPIFKGDVGRVHERVRQQMRVLYEEQSTPTYLDECAGSLLAEARSSYREYGLDTRSVVSCGEDVSLLAPWTGDRELATLRRWLELRNPGLSAQAVPVGLVVPVDEATLRTIIRSMADGSPPTEQELSAGVLVKQIGKYDRFLPEHLLCAEYASRTFDLKRAEAVLRTACDSLR